MQDPGDAPGSAARAAATALAQRTGQDHHDVAIVLGSGWKGAADALGTADVEVPMAGLPGFPIPQASGHGRSARSLRIGASRVLVLLGRSHLYEGHDAQTVAHPVRTACAAGAHTVVLTNAAGGIHDGYEVGQPVLVADHLNLTASSPLTGPDFVDLTDAYDPRLRELARSFDPDLDEGVYAGLPGPQFETPAEIRMLRTLGADLVGMSTVLETIAARAAGAAVLGVSLVTNLAAGLSGAPIDHVDVLTAAETAAERMGNLLRELVKGL